MIRDIIKRLISGVLLVTLIWALNPWSMVGEDLLGEVEAAELRGLEGEFALDKNAQVRDSNGCVSLFGMEMDNISAQSMKSSADVYIPASLLSQFNYDRSDVTKISGINVYMYVRIRDTEKHMRYMVPLKVVSFHLDENGDLDKIFHFDESTHNNEWEPDYASLSKEGDFLKVSLKDCPVDTSMPVNTYDEEKNISGKTTLSAVPKSGKVGLEVTLDVYKTLKLVSGKFFVTNISGKCGGDNNISFDPTIKGEVAYCSAPSSADGYNIQTSAFNTSMLTVSKTKASLSVGRTAKIKVKTAFSDDKVIVKSSKKKVATASYKDGKVMIKAIKPGNATITVKYNGVTKKIKVNVKK